jgi:transposase-like protein
VESTASSTTETKEPVPGAVEPRRWFTPEERKRILERYYTSGLRQQEFVEREGISKASLGKWLQRARGRVKKAKFEEPRFQEVLVPPVTCWQLEIISPKNCIVRFAAMPTGEAIEQVLRSLLC